MGGPERERPGEEYRERRDRHRGREEAARQRASRLGTWRVVVFLAAVGLLWGAEWTTGTPRLALFAAGGVALGGFGLLVARHRRARREARWEDTLARLNEDGLARLGRRWSELPETTSPEDDALPDPAAASDLDLFGDASLRRLLSPVCTSPGEVRIRRWITERADPPEIERRQRAVKGLAGEIDFRQEFAARGRLSGAPDPAALRRFLEWAEGDGWLGQRPWLNGAAWILPLLSWGLVAAQVGGWVAHAWWGVPVVATLLLAGRVTSTIHRVFARASAGDTELARYADLLELLDERSGDAVPPDVAGALSRRVRAAEELRRLDDLVRRAEERHGMMHFVLQVAFFWDVHVLRGLEGWRRRCGGEVRGWLDALGRADALCALGALAYDHPDWAFPRVSEDAAPAVEARELGHPLLSPDACVRNDVQAGPPGTFLLVTGSNMSGKSTLLRAMGINTILAQAGAPVCAARMRLPPTEVRTSIRVRDSVVEGVSLYMAELHRVRSVVETARRLSPGEGPPEDAETRAGGSGPLLLYLLDEPLQGTNEAERREAVRIILRQLLELEAVGAVATHDLRLHRTEGLRDAARVVHFRGDVRESPGEGPALTFDYRLREGPATSTNALDLLRLAGLGPPDA